MKVASASAGVTPLPCVPPPTLGPGPPGGVRAPVRAPVPPAAGLYAGIKFFLIDFIFKRCPRLRAKYDTPYIIWKSLPTDPQLKERSSAPASRRVGPGGGGEGAPGRTPAPLLLARRTLGSPVLRGP